MPRPVEVLVKVASTEEGCARSAADLFQQVVTAAVESRGVARVAISGGSTPKAVFQLLANPGEPYMTMIPWTRLQLFWVDERCVGPDDAESNFGMTRKAMLDEVPLPPENIHRMEGELDPQEGASRYEAAIRNAFRLEGAETPTFDLILLGMGDDGHTASLFPHTEALDEMARIVVANNVPQKDTWRLTLTWPVITQGREVAFLIEGKAKADVVKMVFSGAYDPESHPSQLIRPANGRLTLLLDQGAASGLDLDLRPPSSNDQTATLHLT